MRTELEAPVGVEGASTTALAARLESLTETLAGLIGARAGGSLDQALAELVENLRRVCSALRSLALLQGDPRGFGSIGDGQSFRLILRELADSIRRLVTSNRAIAARVGDQSHELDVLAELPFGSELMERLRLVVDNVRGATAEIEDTLDAMATTIADANGRIRTIERELAEARAKALYDGLTRVYSRATLDERLRAAVAAGDRHGPWCFLLADIDHFKAINDTHGHVVGDAVLYRVANAINDFLRAREKAHLTARYGGEEFGIVLSGTALARAGPVAEQVRETVAATRWQYNRSNEQDIIVVTISIGVAQYRAGDTVSTLVRRADEALYTAKGEGRNRVVLAPS